MNLAGILHASARRHAARPAVTDVRSGRSLTYSDLARESDRVAAFLTAQGVQAGHRIGLLAPNSLAYLPAAFGLLATGACLTPVASNLTPHERAQVLGEVEVNGFLSWSATDSLPHRPEGAIVPGGQCEGFAFQWIDRAAGGPAGFQALNPAFIRFTSGTTANSKGVVLSHEATQARVRAADAVLRFSDEDRILWVLPLAYHFAVTIVAYVGAGAHIIMSPDTLPAPMVDSIRRFGATVLYASPLHFERLTNLPAGQPLPGLRLALSTSAPIAPAVMERFESVYGVPVGQAYGIIEAGLPCINLRTDGLPATSVGRPVPGYEVAAFSDDVHRLPAGVAGEIGVRGAGLFSAYYTPWRRREEITRDGWFLTGDIGRLDETGALSLEGRKKAVIFVAGFKFFPEEVEECINRFPGVSESRVFGHPHPRLGEVPRAEVVMQSPDCDVRALRAHCARALSPYKVPLDFTVVAAVARTAGGKILRRPVAAPSARTAGESQRPGC
ncbi:MAG TPA: class I adenylate-forming enzyme family protein [Candidatus Binatia bacterium]|nr:class I adenylate-forming enzyme family protein [Candidatus Binatia bacterium]